MKLRNKKTGEIWTLTNRNEGPSAVLWVSNGSQTHAIESIEELASNFEDYEEPKERHHWFISGRGTIEYEKDEDDYFNRGHKSIGNYFETKEEAEKAVEKLKAWKRLKDKGVYFTRMEAHPNCIAINGWARDDVKKDLELLFGGKE